MDQIGIIDDDGKLRIDAARLVDTRVLVQGSSGSGKSWLIRLLVEKVAAKIPVLILDLEGEFVTLREKFDFVVAGEGGEVAVDVRSAALLARKLLELKLSGVVSLYDLNKQQQRSYVRAFLESIMAAPRSLWAPRLIVLDEAHIFAPESSQSESLGSVIDLASRGRKRGYCLVAATQRLSKLHKDVAAECRNVFVGQTTLDVDVKRALDTLGFPADLEHKRALKALDHQFYAMGPATSAEGVVLFQADQVKTTHPESGLRRTLSPPEPSRRIKQALGELADLPKQAAEEANDLASAKKQIAELKRQLGSKPAPVADAKAVERAAALAAAERDKVWKAEAAKLERANQTLAKRIEQIAKLAVVNGEAVSVNKPPAFVNNPVHKSHAVLTNSAVSAPVKRVAASAPKDVVGETAAVEGGLPLGEAKILAALIQFPNGLQTENIAVLTGYKSTSRRVYINALVQKGLAQKAGKLVQASAAGRNALPNAEPLPTGSELRDYWLRELPAGEKAIFEVVLAKYPDAASREEITDSTSYKPTSIRVYSNQLKARQIVEKSGDGLRASDNLF